MSVSDGNSRPCKSLPAAFPGLSQVKESKTTKESQAERDTDIGIPDSADRLYVCYSIVDVYVVVNSRCRIYLLINHIFLGVIYSNLSKFMVI